MRWPTKGAMWAPAVRASRPSVAVGWGVGPRGPIVAGEAAPVGAAVAAEVAALVALEGRRLPAEACRTTFRCGGCF